MKIGFTGNQKGMTLEQKKQLKNLLLKFNPSEFHHGDCIGSDKDADEIANHLKIKIVIHPPANSLKRSYCKSKYILTENEYIKRNHNIVNCIDILIATPKGKKEILRSGTWATIRYARKISKNIIILI